MEIRIGWATDYGKNKWDIAVQETDILRMLFERGVADPEQVRLRMTTTDVGRIMDAEGKWFVHFSLAKAEPEQRGQHAAAASAARAARENLLDKYAPRPVPPEAAAAPAE
jgi:hypothetical protein